MKITAFYLCWLLILTAPGVMAQQTTGPNQSWDVLRQMPVTGSLRVERKDGKKKVSGKFVSQSDMELVIERKRKNVSFRRDEVKNIWRVAPPSKWKKEIFSAIGGGVGAIFGAGILLGIALDDLPNSSAEDAGALAAFFGLPVAGYFAGRALAGSGKRTLIYSAP